MALFSRKSKSKDKPSAEKSEEDAVTKQSISSKPAKRNTLIKAQSQPVSRANSMRGESKISFLHSQKNPNISTAQPLHAPHDTIAFGGSDSYLPVPEIPVGMQKERARASKAAKVLGLSLQDMRSAPASPQLRPRGDQRSFSRHDSFNSNADAIRTGPPSGPVSLLEELVLQPEFSQSAQALSNDVRPSVSRDGNVEDVSPESRSALLRRHTTQSYTLQQLRGRPLTQSPSYSIPTNTHRADLQIDVDRYQHHHNHTPAAQPVSRAQSIAPEQRTDSPLMFPRYRAMCEETESIRSSSTQPPMFRYASEHSTTSQLPPLSILDGLKVNKRGRILDEEGDPIGELFEGDIIDCVRQKANAFGEVLDEYGRVVGRVQTLPNGVVTPAPLRSSAITPDYFNLGSHSSMAVSKIDAQALQRRLRDEVHQKFRMSLDIPPVPCMPVARQEELPLPVSIDRHSFGGICAELPAEEGLAPLDVPTVFDLSEPFLPMSSPVSADISTEPVKSADEVEEVAAAPAHNAIAIPEKSRRRGLSVSSREEPPKPALVEPHMETSVTEEVSAFYRQPVQDDVLDEEPDEIIAPQPVLPVVQQRVPSKFQPRIVSVSRPAETARQQPVVVMPLTTMAQEHAAATFAKIELQENAAEEQLNTAIPREAAAVQANTKTAPEPATAQADTKTAPEPAAAQANTEVSQPGAEPAGIAAEPHNEATDKAATSPSSTTRVTTSPYKSTSLTAPPPLPHAKSMPEVSSTSVSTSDYNSAEESCSEAESMGITTVQRKEVRISNLPPTTIPNRGIGRSISENNVLSRINAMPSVPESEAVSHTPGKNALLTPGSRKAPPLPSFPRQMFTTSSLPTSPFAAANAANSNRVSAPKRVTRPGAPPAGTRSAIINRNHRYTMSTPLVSSPLSGGAHRKTLSTITASTVSSVSSDSIPSGASDDGSDKAKSDAISIVSTPSTKSRTFFTHTGRVTVDAGDLPSSMLKKELVEITERPLTSDSKQDPVKKRFSFKLGKKRNSAVAH